MKKTFVSALTVAVALSVGAGAVAPAIAAPAASAQFVQVANHHNRGFYRQGNYAYYNGHRGDRHRHPGWRESNGYWFPPSAFIGLAIGGIIGSAIAHSR